MNYSINLETLSTPVLIAIAKESKSPEVLRMLLKVNEVVLCGRVAENVYADAETLRALYEKYKDNVRLSLIGNSSTPPDVLHDIVLKISEFREAEKILSNPSLEADDINCLLEGYGNYPSYRNEELIKKIIAHPNTSAKTLIKIAEVRTQYSEAILNTGKVKLVENDV